MPAVIGRRAALLGVGAIPVAMAQPTRLPVPPGGRLGFRIMRKGSKIGEHNSSFEMKNDLLTIRSESEIVVNLMGIPVFRYVHHAVERWQGGAFTSLETKTSDDGTSFWVQVQREAAGLGVSSSTAKKYVAPPEALAMTHWNRADLAVPKINPQKGDLLRPVVADRGMDRVPSAAGGTIAARHYNLSGTAILDVWYDAEDRWAALAFLGGDQSQITLERL